MDISLQLRARKTLGEREVHYQWLHSFLLACKEMNITDIETLLHDDAVLDDKSKWEFLTVLKDRFRLYREQGAETLLEKREVCILCQRGCAVTFLEATLGVGLGLVLKREGALVTDIILCNGSTGIFKDSALKQRWYKIYPLPNKGQNFVK